MASIGATRCATSDPTPVNQPNKEAKASAEVGEGRVQLEENIVHAHMLLTQSRNHACPSVWTVCVKQTAVWVRPTPFIL